MIKILVVVAKFTEDITWTTELKYPYKIYDKSDGSIPNVGRESETYLRYIVEHYPDFPDYIIFLQGHPFDHVEQESKEEFITFLNSWTPTSNRIIYLNKKRHDYVESRAQNTYKKIFNCIGNPMIYFGSGAQYIVPKECILCRTKDFYVKLRHILVSYNNMYPGSRNLDPWILERLWPSIWNPDVFERNFDVKELLD